MVAANGKLTVDEVCAALKLCDNCPRRGAGEDPERSEARDVVIYAALVSGDVDAGSVEPFMQCCGVSAVCQRWREIRRDRDISRSVEAAWERVKQQMP